MNSSTPTPQASAAEYSECVRVVLSVARELSLDTPVFRSPPKIASVDRSIQRRGGSTVVAIRRDSRPLAAVQADIIEGVVVANYLDPEQANELRRLSWAALASKGSVQVRSSTTTPTKRGNNPSGAGSVVSLDAHVRRAA